MKYRGGQILIEILIAGLLVIFISLAITHAITASLRGISQTAAKTTAVFLSREMTEAVRTIAEEDWHFISNLTTSTPSSITAYFATTTGNPPKWAISTGAETLTLNNLSYARYFYVSDVNRSTNTGNIVSSGGYYDPSSMKVTTSVTSTDSGGRPVQFSQVVYLSRFFNDIYTQTDWSGGVTTSIVVTASITSYSSSSNIATTSYGGETSFLLQTQ